MSNITITSLKPASWAEEATNIKNYFTLNTWQLIVLLGIAISGLAAFVLPVLFPVPSARPHQQGLPAL